MSDRIQKLQEGDEEAFQQMVVEFGSMVVNLAFRFIGNKSDAEDVSQDVFIKIWKNVKSYKGESSLKTWVYRITVNESLNFVRRQKINSFIGFLESGISISDDSAEEALLRKEKTNLVRKAIQKLPKNQRIAITLRSFKNLSYDEIAEIMDISKSSVESLLFRAKKGLKKKLSNYYFSKY
jgi:RNA polymerase sigma-70 factor (ECF subfamily)